MEFYALQFRTDGVIQLNVKLDFTSRYTECDFEFFCTKFTSEIVNTLQLAFMTSFSCDLPVAAVLE